jgi:hypothetical protein
MKLRNKIYSLFLLFMRHGPINSILLIKSKKRFEVELDDKYTINETSITDSKAHNTYLTLCGLAASDDKVFKKFRSAKVMIQVLDHVSIEQGKEYISEILKLTKWDTNFTKIIEKLDEYGKPNKFYFKPYGKFSPTLLRYLKVNFDLIKYFGPIEGYNVTEIGGGFGGQASVINLLNSISSYTLYDLLPVLDLTKKFIELNKIPGNFTFNDGIDPKIIKSDLIISNYAFSELSRSIQDEYINNIILNSSRGYITWNPLSWRDLGGYQPAELIKFIPNSQIFPEKPLTYKGNVVIVWKPVVS